MSEQERDIMENFPCVSLDIINEIDFSEMKRKIYLVKLLGHMIYLIKKVRK